MNRIVFTNGCFDIIHPGHIDLLQKASCLGHHLIVGLNSDLSVSRIKPGRPINDQYFRKTVLQNIKGVDEVIIFDEDTPINLIKAIKPDVLVKGGDWPLDQIVGYEFVESCGGAVFSLPLLTGFSTTSIIEKIRGC